jgi:hypothetical protein
VEYDAKQDMILEEQALKDEEHDRKIVERIEYDARQDKILAQHTRKVLEHEKQLLSQQEKNKEYECELARMHELNCKLEQEVLNNINVIKKLEQIVEQINEEKSSKKVSLYSLILGGMSLIGVIISFFML